MSHKKLKPILLAATLLSFAHAAPAWAQDESPAEADTASGNDIIVTARRVDERLQDVPISITVFSQEALSNNNVTSMKDLAAFTPGLQVNNRFGSDSTNFSIRGFTQEQRTTATVGTYFADVVAPRGSGATFGGEGAGPGALFDLQNVQVLKGPQGTLFGRNSTGGAVLLVPRKPVDRLEGYVEASIGDYELRRVQAVLNIPLAETFRVRLGVDRMTRDGFLRNIGRFGDGLTGNKGMGNVDYWTFRASMIGDLTPDLENYTVASYTKTKSNGVMPTIVECFPGINASGIPFGNMACAQLARENQFDPWTVSNRLRNHGSFTETWQVINTLTWQASDSLTVKNILSYGEFRGTTNLDLFGNYFLNPSVPSGTETSGNQVTGFAFTSANPYNNRTNAQSTFIGELQLQGSPGDGRFVWQAGLYTELNNPLGFSGVQTAQFSACNDITVRDCIVAPAFSFGLVNLQLSSTKFTNYAAYGQASYSLTDQLKLTAGIRHTWDKQVTDVSTRGISVAGATAGTFNCSNPIGTGTPSSVRFPISEALVRCHQSISKATAKPTWLIGVDFKPVEDVLLYAKWSRGYRQGGLSIFSPDTTQTYEAESVDTYEVGAKAGWQGAVPGSFNISGFYNAFTNQQLLLGVTDQLPNPPGVPTAPTSASVVNAGKSRMYGFEAELNVRPFDGLRLSVAYGYLNTKVQAFVPPTFAPGSPYDTATGPVVGDVIPNSQPHKLNITADYTLPLPQSVGAVTIGGTFVYTARYRSVVDACPVINVAIGCLASNSRVGTGFVPGTNVLNLSANWTDVFGMPLDAGVFVTNVTNEVVYLNVNDNTSRGFRSSLLGEPRMYGFRLRYKIGE